MVTQGSGSGGGATRRDLLRAGAALAVCGDLRGQAEGPESFQVYTEGPRLFLRPARLKLLRREKERRSLRWEQFDNLWLSAPQYPEFGWTAALRYRIADDGSAGGQAVAWAAGTATDVRQIALILDWCGPLISTADRALIIPKLEKVVTAPLRSAMTLDEARNRVLAAVALTDAKPAVAEKALRELYGGFWIGSFVPGLKAGRIHVPNAEANALVEIMHAFRDNLNFDLRETFPQWFKDYPLIHVLAHYPEPFPAAENEYRIPADAAMDQKGPDPAKAVYSRSAELAMVAFDANAMETQLLQGFLMNDKFLMRGTLGIPYELMWANPYQPGLSYYHIPLVAHDAVGGELYVRSSWEDDARWLGFFGGGLQVFGGGELKMVDPKVAHAPIDVEEATVFFARGEAKFQVPARPQPTAAPTDSEQGAVDALDDVFIIGLDARRRYHVEADGEGMFGASSDGGGIIYLPGLPAGAQVRFAPV